MATPKKTTTKKTATAPRKPRTVKAAAEKEHKPKAAEAAVEHVEEHVHKPHAEALPEVVLPKADGKYFYAVGRRKTAVANVRLFFGKSKSQVNKKDPAQYFGTFVSDAYKPLQLTGLEHQVYVYANISGGGVHSQAQAMAHGIAQAVAIASPDFHKVLKKNGMLTRDDRKKERKKPGLKRARRGPQWAKR